MKGMISMKKIIMVFILLVVIVFTFIIIIVSNNNKYTDNITKDIIANYKVNGKINYLNKSGLYYIIIDNVNLIVLDNNYKVVLEQEKIARNNKYNVVYKQNRLMYEEDKVIKGKIRYTYYDINTLEKIKDITIGG